MNLHRIKHRHGRLECNFIVKIFDRRVSRRGDCWGPSVIRHTCGDCFRPPNFVLYSYMSSVDRIGDNAALSFFSTEVNFSFIMSAIFSANSIALVTFNCRFYLRFFDCFSHASWERYGYGQSLCNHNHRRQNVKCTELRSKSSRIKPGLSFSLDLVLWTSNFSSLPLHFHLYNENNNRDYFLRLLWLLSELIYLST